MERGVKKRVVLAVSLIVLVTAAFFVFSFSDSNLEPKFSNNTNISLTNDSTLSSAAVNIQPLSLEIENKTPILNQTNSSVTKKKSRGGGGGGGSGGGGGGGGGESSASEPPSTGTDTNTNKKPPAESVEGKTINFDVTQTVV